MERATGVFPLLAVLAVLVLNGNPIRADERVPFSLDVENASAKVGNQTTVKATITPPEGFEIRRSYRNRVVELSALDDQGVDFQDEVVLGSIEDDGSIVFELGVVPTEPGTHPINGLIRVGFIKGTTAESKSVPLMATVTGTQ